MFTWEQKFAAIDALAEASIKFRKAGDWYISQNVEIKDGGVLCAEYGNGATPEEAIEDHWRILTSVGYPKYLVANSGRDTRKAVLWNGFMWNAVTEEKAA